MGRRFTARLRNVVTSQVTCQVKDQFLKTASRAIRVEVNALDLPWAGKRMATLVVGQRCFHLDLGRNVHRIEYERRGPIQIDHYAIAHCLSVTLDAWVLDLETRLRRDRMHVIALRRWRLGARVGFERDHLKRHAENLRDFFRQQSPVGEVRVVGATQPAAHHLFAQELRHEWAQANDVRHRVAVPAFGEHADADDAAHVAAGGMQRSPELLRELFESFRPDRSAQPVLGHRSLAGQRFARTYPRSAPW